MLMMMLLLLTSFNPQAITLRLLICSLSENGFLCLNEKLAAAFLLSVVGIFSRFSQNVKYSYEFHVLFVS
jgi:hypothetical protein